MHLLLVDRYVLLSVLGQPSCLSQPCKNGGSCVQVEESYTCNCPEHYRGVTCQIGEPHVIYTYLEFRLFLSVGLKNEPDFYVIEYVILHILVPNLCT